MDDKYDLLCCMELKEYFGLVHLSLSSAMILILGFRIVCFKSIISSFV